VVNPSYFELFADAFGYVGNPALEPERNRSIDLGAEFPLAGGRGAVDVTLFAEVLEQEIVEASDGAGGLTFENESGESRRSGLEISARLQASETLGLRAGYTYLQAENSDGSKEIRRPEHELSLGATMAAFGGRGSVSADLRHVAGLTDNAFFGDFATGVELDPFTTVGLAASYDLRPGLQLYGRVENLFDAEYSEVLGYVAAGRTLYAGLRASF
jgi:vitamin B12 transporter